MVWQAHVYLQRLPGRELDDVGTLTLDGFAVRYGHVKFEVNGKTEVGLIELIEPNDWQRPPWHASERAHFSDLEV